MLKNWIPAEKPDSEAMKERLEHEKEKLAVQQMKI